MSCTNSIKIDSSIITAWLRNNIDLYNGQLYHCNWWLVMSCTCNYPLQLINNNILLLAMIVISCLTRILLHFLWVIFKGLHGGVLTRGGDWNLYGTISGGTVISFCFCKVLWVCVCVGGWRGFMLIPPKSSLDPRLWCRTETQPPATPTARLYPHYILSYFYGYIPRKVLVCTRLSSILEVSMHFTQWSQIFQQQSPLQWVPWLSWRQRTRCNVSFSKLWTLLCVFSVPL